MYAKVKRSTHNLSFTVQTHACALKNLSFGVQRGLEIDTKSDFQPYLSPRPLCIITLFLSSIIFNKCVFSNICVSGVYY